MSGDPKPGQWYESEHGSLRIDRVTDEWVYMLRVFKGCLPIDGDLVRRPRSEWTSDAAAWGLRLRGGGES